MKLKTILYLALAFSFSADAAENVVTNVVTELRRRLKSKEVTENDPEVRLWRRLESAASGHCPPLRVGDTAREDPPPPPPKENRYEILVRESAEDGISQSAVDAMILALAEYYNSQLKPGVDPSQQNGWNSGCSGMFGLMRLSGDRDYFLPTIEKLGMESVDGTVREHAVMNHVGMCGFDSFPFMKRVMTEMPASTLMERDDRCRMVNAFLSPMAWWEFPLSEEQAAELCRWLLEQIRITDDVILLKLYDMYLVAHLPEYKNSRQRLTLLSREDVDKTGIEGWFDAYFPPSKVAVEAVPPSERPDLRIRFPDLLPSAGEPETPEKTGFPRVWLAVGTAALLALAAAALLFKAKKSRAP